jgi:hypothetical protein
MEMQRQQMSEILGEDRTLQSEAFGAWQIAALESGMAPGELEAAAPPSACAFWRPQRSRRNPGEPPDRGNVALLAQIQEALGREPLCDGSVDLQFSGILRNFHKGASHAEITFNQNLGNLHWSTRHAIPGGAMSLANDSYF